MDNFEKKYNEALERAKELIAKWTGKNKDFYTEDYAYIFPELSESEDERIRKWLTDLFSNRNEKFVQELDNYRGLVTREQILAYLEKQKEQKPYEPHNWPADKDNLTQEQKPISQEDFDTAKHEALWGEQKPIQSAEEKEFVRTIKSIIADFIRDKKPEDVGFYQQIYNWLDGRHIEQKPNIEICPHSIKSKSYNEQKPVEPSGKLSRQDYLYQLLIDQLITYSDYEYLTKKNPAWSEEDEKILNRIIETLSLPPIYDTKACAKMVSWLQSLRPQWKPSDEDEERLINTSISFLKDFADKGYENAVECIDWLKSKLNGDSGK